MTPKEEFLTTFPVIVTQAVLWGEMDAYQHVNNVAYFRYFENGRLEYIRRIGWFRIEAETGVGPILASTQARFRRALTYPDTIHIGTRLLELKEDRFTIEHKIFSEALGEIATVGDGLIVAFHYPSQKKAALPEQLRTNLLNLEGRKN